jgi:transcriptional regulator with XRE-family HTH domain
MTRSDEEMFGSWLSRQLRIRRMSQRQLATRSGVDHSTISRLIRSDRQPSLATASRISRVLRDTEDGELPGRHPAAPSPALHDPVARVERALRADERLSEAQVRRLMYQYLAERQSIDGPARAEDGPIHGTAVDRAQGAGSRPGGRAR